MTNRDVVFRIIATFWILTNVITYLTCGLDTLAIINVVVLVLIGMFVLFSGNYRPLRKWLDTKYVPPKS